jgi:Rhodopirellula transposase DDE domain
MAPYGVYDIAVDAGWLSLGITHDTAAFAVASIRTWLERIGRKRYPNARELNNYGGLRWIKWCACEALEGGTPESSRTRPL